MGLPNPSRETKFSGANGDREIYIFPVQLTTDWQPYPVDPYPCCMCDHTYIIIPTLSVGGVKCAINSLRVTTIANKLEVAAANRIITV